jgi:hypothetical protein
VLCALCFVLCTLCLVADWIESSSTKYKVLSTKYKAPSTKHQVHSQIVLNQRQATIRLCSPAPVRTRAFVVKHVFVPQIFRDDPGTGFARFPSNPRQLIYGELPHEAQDFDSR